MTHETRFFSYLASSNSYPGQDANPISKKRQQTVFWKWFYYISSVCLLYLMNLTFISGATPASRYTDENKQDDRNAVTWPFCTVTVYLRFLAMTRPWSGSTNRQKPELQCITNLNRNRRSSGLLILTCGHPIKWPRRRGFIIATLLQDNREHCRMITVKSSLSNIHDVTSPLDSSRRQRWVIGAVPCRWRLHARDRALRDSRV